MLAASSPYRNGASAVSLDIRTLTLAVAVVSLVAAFVLLVYWRSQRIYAGFGFWVAANFMATGTFLLFALRGLLPDVLSVGLANLAAVGIVLLRLEGVRRFHQREGAGRWSVLVAALCAPAIFILAFQRDDLVMRTVLVSLVVCVYAMLIAREFLLGRLPGRLGVAIVLAALHIVIGLVVLARALAWVFFPAERGLFAATPFNVAFFLTQLATDVGISVAFLALHAQRAAQELEESRQQLEALASKDALTGALNRRTFFVQAEAEFVRSRRLQQPLGVLMLDLDHFKLVNDRWGHAAGDAALRHVVSVAGSRLREFDPVGRIGGEEFAVLLPGAAEEGARAVAERLREAVESEPVVAGELSFPLTLSAGAAELSEADANLDALLARADEALYQAKRDGRNRVSS